MLNFVKDIGTFAWLVISNVAALMTGGIIAALITAYEHWTAGSISFWSFKWSIAAYFIITCFVVWREEHSKARNKNQALADLLTERRTWAIHNIENQPITDDVFVREELRQRETKWLTDLKQLMTEHGCSAQEISSVSDISESELKAVARSTGFHDRNPGGIFKAMVHIRLKRLKEVIDAYSIKPM